MAQPYSETENYVDADAVADAEPQPDPDSDPGAPLHLCA